MKTTSITIAATALLFGSAALSGCSAEAEPEVTPAQQAELDQSREDLKKRGWVDIPPMHGTETAKPEGEGEAESTDPSATDAPPTE